MQIVPVKLTGESDPVSAWVIGQQVAVPRAGDYGLYFVYPMTRERDTLALVGRFLLLGGVVLMLLLGGIAYVVTRLVVAPVRRAADVAQRFAAGALGERMTAKGEDDLATLATSFNEMAAEHPAADRPAGEPVAVPATVRLRRLARAADPADDDPDGRRPHPRLARRTSTPRSRGRPSCCTTSWTGSRPCSPTCSRSAGSTRARPSSTSSPPTSGPP